MLGERIPVYLRNTPLPHELDDDVLVIEVMSYVINNNIKSDLDFLNVLLSDVRVNIHKDWYGRYFSDAQFREFLTDCFVCQKYSELNMFLDDRLHAKAWDGTWSQAYGRF